MILDWIAALITAIIYTWLVYAADKNLGRRD